MKWRGGYIAFCLILFLVLISCDHSESDTSSKFSLQDETFMHLDYNTLELYTSVQYALPVFSHLYSNAGQVPLYGENICKELLRDYKNPETLLYHTFRILGAPAGGYGPPLSGSPHEIPQWPDLNGFYFEGSGKERWNSLPVNARNAILEVIDGMLMADTVMQQFLSPIVNALDLGEREPELFALLTEPWRSREILNFTTMDLMEQADLRKLSFASRLLTSAVSKLIRLEDVSLFPDFDQCIIHSPMGTIALFGRERDTIEGAYCLIIDFGGDDLYRGRIASPLLIENPLSVVVDLSGDDRYDSGDEYLVNGCLGIAILIDKEGKDSYSSGKAGLASSCYGASLLYDLCGNDSYISKSPFSQGAAHLGSAILVDLEGEDMYCSEGHSQGYGGTLGVGLLLDGSGNDLYNQGCPGASFVQGAARGRWAEASDSHSLGGGMGIFVEAGGDDAYYANSFSQGASYFVGTGLFFDMDGDDRYHALSHSQGYSAHFALSGFFEKQGDDSYNANVDFGKITQILGGGRDLSVGWFVENGGNDSYHFGNRSAGVGDMEGVGILWDRGGKDAFTWHQNRVNAGNASLGQTFTLSSAMATSFREFSTVIKSSTGIFRDDQKSEFITVKNE